MLILSSINFKIAVTTRLPTVSYLTVLDKYLLSGLIFMALLCAYHSVIGSSLFTFIGSTNLAYYDLIFLYIFVSLYATFHISYIFYFLVKLMKQKKVENELRKQNQISFESWGQDSYRLKASSPLSANSISPLIK